TGRGWLSGILCRHPAAVNRHGADGPDQHGSRHDRVHRARAEPIRARAAWDWGSALSGRPRFPAPGTAGTFAGTARAQTARFALFLRVALARSGRPLSVRFPANSLVMCYGTPG